MTHTVKLVAEVPLRGAKLVLAEVGWFSDDVELPFEIYVEHAGGKHHVSYHRTETAAREAFARLAPESL